LFILWVYWRWLISRKLDPRKFRLTEKNCK
jgi:hypothetical protein